jgi:signal transduction protein with GAF and PtsI domain
MFTSSGQIGGLSVVTTDYRGFTPDELADRALHRIIKIGDSSHPAIRDQALAFKEQIRSVILLYMREAIQQDRATIAQKLREAGHPELVAVIGE